jgi:hypothetical protein
MYAKSYSATKLANWDESDKPTGHTLLTLTIVINIFILSKDKRYEIR